MSLHGKERLVLRVPSILTLHDISRSGRVLLSKDDAQVGMVVRVPGDKAERDVSWFDWSLISDFSKDGKTLVFSETGEAVGAKYGIYLRKTDGSPAIRLGDGAFASLSPDGKWVVVNAVNDGQLELLPTGAGEPKLLTHDNIQHLFSTWHPDGKEIIFIGVDPGHGRRTYIYDVSTGATRPITAEGTLGNFVSPDGSKMLITANGQDFAVFPLRNDGTPPKPVKGMLPDEQPLEWDSDNKHLLGMNPTQAPLFPLTVFRLDPETGERQPWKQISGIDPAGVESIMSVRFDSSGNSYAYSYYRVLSELYVIEGLK
jgi:WD40 repeat protein